MNIKKLAEQSRMVEDDGRWFTDDKDACVDVSTESLELLVNFATQELQLKIKMALRFLQIGSNLDVLKAIDILKSGE